MSDKTRAIQSSTATAMLDRIIADMANDNLSWTQPWLSIGRPINALTRKPYNGYNHWALSLTTLDRGYTSPEWATYKQWQTMHAQVQKGERGTAGIFAGKQLVEDRKTGVEKLVWITRAFTLFHRDQTDAPPLDPPTATDSLDESIVKQVLQLYEDNHINYSHGGDRAFYRPSTDTITLPPLEAFLSPQGFASTALHEASHWTGHESRLNRHTSPAPFGSPPYAREELTAELANVLVGTTMGLVSVDEEADEHRLQSVAYMRSWLKGEKPETLIDVLSDAAKAAEYLTRKGEE